jgi:hypothetical protein
MSGLSAGAQTAAVVLPASAAIPVTFTQTLEAGKARAGDAVTARTMEAVRLDGGRVLAKGTKLQGHVVASSRLQRGAGTGESVLSIRFDSVKVDGADVPAALAVRALAGRLYTRDAQTPHYLDGKDHVGTFSLVGGGLYARNDDAVLAGNDETIGHNGKDGVVAALSEGDRPGFECAATQSEEPVGIFSPKACGLYGYAGMHGVASKGAAGVFTLVSSTRNVTIHAYTAALLQVTGERQVASR